jgi:phage-related tail protein
MKDEHKETDTEKLAGMMARGFERIEEQFKEVKEQITGVENNLQGQINGLREEVQEAHKDIVDIRLEQKETNRHLESIDQKQFGQLQSLDETVPRAEFEELTERVVVLETKFA